MDSLTLTAGQRRRLQRQLETAPDARLYRRTLAVLEVARGQPVAAVARILGVTPRSVYHWLRAYADGRDPASLRDAPRPGRPGLWTEEGRECLLASLGRSPQDLGYAAAGWTVPLLREHLGRRAGRWLPEDTIRRELQRQGYAWKRARYVLDPDPELEKKTRHPPPRPGPAAPHRPAGRGRDGPAAVPAPAGRVGAAGRAAGGPPDRAERAAGHLRGAEPAHRPPRVPGPGAPAGG
jgi:transposase